MTTVNIKVDDVIVVDGTAILLFKCTKCGDQKQINGFGIRTMGDGTTRRQAQCNNCRSSR